MVALDQYFNNIKLSFKYHQCTYLCQNQDPMFLGQSLSKDEERHHLIKFQLVRAYQLISIKACRTILKVNQILKRTSLK